MALNSTQIELHEDLTERQFKKAQRLRWNSPYNGRQRAPLHVPDSTVVVDTFLDQTPAERIREYILAGRQLAVNKAAHLREMDLYDLPAMPDDLDYGHENADQEMASVEKSMDPTRQPGYDPAIGHQKWMLHREAILNAKLEAAKAAKAAKKPPETSQETSQEKSETPKETGDKPT